MSDPWPETPEGVPIDLGDGVFATKDEIRQVLRDTANICRQCAGRGRVLVTYAIEGGTRTKFMDCECSAVKEESRQSPRFETCRFAFRHGMKGTMHDYRDDLARFPGDPQAYVDGPRAVQKLIDQRKREGWQFHKDYSQALGDGPKSPKTGEQIAREAFERARDKGFKEEE